MGARVGLMGWMVSGLVRRLMGLVGLLWLCGGVSSLGAGLWLSLGVFGLLILALSWAGGFRGGRGGLGGGLGLLGLGSGVAGGRGIFGVIFSTESVRVPLGTRIECISAKAVNRIISRGAASRIN